MAEQLATFKEEFSAMIHEDGVTEFIQGENLMPKLITDKRQVKINAPEKVEVTL